MRSLFLLLDKFIIRKMSGRLGAIIKANEVFQLDEMRRKSGVEIHPTFMHGKHIHFEISEKIALFRVSENVSCRNYCNFLVRENATLILEKNVFLNNYASINCLHQISIGENTQIGEGVKMYDHNHKHYLDEKGNRVVEKDLFTFAPIVIGKNCWIGSNVTILKGVEIGDNVIVGANCLVHKSIPSNSVVKHSELLIHSMN